MANVTADLIQNGKLSLDANTHFPLGMRSYRQDAINPRQENGKQPSRMGHFARGGMVGENTT